MVLGEGTLPLPSLTPLENRGLEGGGGGGGSVHNLSWRTAPSARRKRSDPPLAKPLQNPTPPQPPPPPPHPPPSPAHPPPSYPPPFFHPTHPHQPRLTDSTRTPSPQHPPQPHAAPPHPHTNTLQQLKALSYPEEKSFRPTEAQNLE